MEIQLLYSVVVIHYTHEIHTHAQTVALDMHKGRNVRGRGLRVVELGVRCLAQELPVLHRLHTSYLPGT